MKKKKILIAAAWVALLASAFGARVAEPKRPNIVFIVADDQRYDMLSCTGNRYAKTPHLDRLASEGMRFSRAFVTCAVCMPSRASLFTGKQPHNAGAPTILHMPHTFHRNQPTFPARLHEAGYHTAHFGKWHLGEGTKRQPGYDHWAGYYACSPFHNPLITTNGKERRHQGYTDFIVADMAADHIRKIADKDRPFFLFWGLAAPHLPFLYPKKYERLFAGVDIAKPASFDEDYEKTGKARFMKEFIGVKEFKGAIPRFGSWENYVKSYYRSSQSIDESVGKLLTALDEAKIADDTIVIYTSDHGYSLGEHGLTEKHFSYEGMTGGKGAERFLLGFKVELLTERDPFVRVRFSQDTAALRGWVDGEWLYDRRTKAHPAELQFNKAFNPPLKPGINTLVFAGAVKDFLSSKVIVMTWKGKTRLVE